MSPARSLLMLVALQVALTSLLQLGASRTLGVPVNGALVASPIVLNRDEDDSFLLASAFSPDGKLIAGGARGQVILWDAKSGRRLTESETRDTCRYLTFSPDGKLLATVHEARLIEPRARVRVWRITEHNELREVQCFPSFVLPAGVWHAAFSPDGSTVISGDHAGTIQVWNLDTGEERVRFHGGIAAFVPPDGESMLTVTHDGVVHRWLPGTNRLVQRAQERNEFIHVTHLAFAHDGSLVALSDGHTIWIKDTATNRVVHRLSPPSAVSGLTFSPDRSILAVGCDGGASFIDMTTYAERAWLPDRNGGSFSPAGQHFAANHGRGLVIEETAAILRRGGIAPLPPSTDPPDLALRADLVAIQDTYELDLQGLTRQALSDHIYDDRISSPKVNLVCRIVNTGRQPVRIERPFAKPELYLTGTGAINFPEEPIQVAAGFRREMPEPVSLAPGESHGIGIKTLEGYTGSYWLTEGDYLVYARFLLSISPAPSGATDVSSDGFARVHLRCSPIKLRVVASRTPSADPLEVAQATPPLGSLVPIVDKATLQTRDKLAMPSSIDGFEPGRLKEHLHYLSQRYDIDFHFDNEAFRKLGKEKIAETRTSLPKIENASLNYLLHSLLQQIDATYELRRTEVWIVPDTRHRTMSERLSPPPGYLRERIAEQLELPAEVNDALQAGTTLGAALHELRDRFGLAIEIDHRAFERKGMKEIALKRVQLDRQRNVTLADLLKQLSKQAGARYVLREHFVMIVPAS